jgi:hypothetical protein
MHTMAGLVEAHVNIPLDIPEPKSTSAPCSIGALDCLLLTKQGSLERDSDDKHLSFAETSHVDKQPRFVQHDPMPYLASQAPGCRHPRQHQAGRSREGLK